MLGDSRLWPPSLIQYLQAHGLVLMAFFFSVPCPLLPEWRDMRLLHDSLLRHTQRQSHNIDPSHAFKWEIV